MQDTMVVHPIHGVGRVLSLRRGGREAVVAFEALPLPTLVPCRELEGLSGVGAATAPGSAAAGPSPAPLAPGAQTTLARGTPQALRVLEAMRLGIVPEGAIDAYTVGREAELAAMAEDLERVEAEGGAVRAFLGSYGAGKTHLLELAAQRALEAGFVVAHVVLDAQEVAPSHPRRVYHALMRSLRFPGSGIGGAGWGLEHLLGQALLGEEARAGMGLGRRWPLGGTGCGGGLGPGREEGGHGRHLYLSAALEGLDALGLAQTSPNRGRRRKAVDDAHLEKTRQVLLAWIAGSPTVSNGEVMEMLAPVGQGGIRLYSLMDYRPWARIYAYMLSGVATLARLVGYRGLAVLVDEAELYALLSRENRLYARTLFKALAYAAVGAHGAPFDPEELELGGYGVLRSLPARFREDSALYVTLALTPNEEGIQTLRETVPKHAITELRALVDGDYYELYERVLAQYRDAHPAFSLSPGGRQALGELVQLWRRTGRIASPREAIKALVECLDLARHMPDRWDTVVREAHHRAMFG